MRPTSITRPRSEWIEIDREGRLRTSLQLPANTRIFRRNVGTGRLIAIVAEEPLGWHMSISFGVDIPLDKVQPSKLRYPTWDEIRHARDTLLPKNLEFAMFLPPEDEYVNFHERTFHLHEYPLRTNSGRSQETRELT